MYLNRLCACTTASHREQLRLLRYQVLHAPRPRAHSPPMEVLSRYRTATALWRHSRITTTAITVTTFVVILDMT